jgi:hypothetical protein
MSWRKSVNTVVAPMCKHCHGVVPPACRGRRPRRQRLVCRVVSRIGSRGCGFRRWRRRVLSAPAPGGRPRKMAAAPVERRFRRGRRNRHAGRARSPFRGVSIPLLLGSVCLNRGTSARFPSKLPGRSVALAERRSVAGFGAMVPKNNPAQERVLAAPDGILERLVGG